MSLSGQTFKERYGNEPMTVDESDGCEHAHAQLVYVGAALEEWHCFDCGKKVRVWSSSP